MIEVQITTRVMSDEVRSKCIGRTKDLMLFKTFKEIDPHMKPTNKLEYKDCEIRKVYYVKNGFELIRPFASIVKIKRQRNEKKLNQSNNN